MQQWGWVGLATLAVLLLRVGYIQWWHPYGLAPDEAQYWSWLQHNDWSFLTKPPLTTWLIGVSTWVLGDTLLGVKLFALLGQVAVGLLGFAIAREITGARLAAPSRKLAGRDGEALTLPATRKNAWGNASGWWAWALLTTVPLVAAGGLIMNPDAVLLPLWLAATLCVVRGVRKEEGTKEPRNQGLCWGRWVIIGVLVGLGGLAKYTAALFYPLLFGYALLWRREWVVKPQIYVSGLIALIFQLPVLVWNFQHDWVGVAHVLWQADGGGDLRHGGLQSFLEMVGGQALVLGPVVFALVVWAVGQEIRNKKQETRWLVWVCAVIVMGFVMLSFNSKVQANWPVLGAVSGLLVLAGWLGGIRYEVSGIRKWLLYVAGVGIIINSVLSLMLMDTYKARDLGLLPLKAKNDPTKDLRGWEDMGVLVRAVAGKLHDPVILSSRYQTLAPLMFHAGGAGEFAYINAEGRRKNQYDLWPLPDMNRRIVVYVNEQGVLPEGVRGMFENCEAWHTLGVEEYGIQVRTLGMWVCWGARTVG